MNRAAVDEEDQSEILKIFELERSSWRMFDYDDFENFCVEIEHKGMIFYRQNDI